MPVKIFLFWIRSPLHVSNNRWDGCSSGHVRPPEQFVLSKMTRYSSSPVRPGFYAYKIDNMTTTGVQSGTTLRSQWGRITQLDRSNVDGLRNFWLTHWVIHIPSILFRRTVLFILISRHDLLLIHVGYYDPARVTIFFCFNGSTDTFAVYNFSCIYALWNAHLLLNYALVSKLFH